MTDQSTNSQSGPIFDDRENDVFNAFATRYPDVCSAKKRLLLGDIQIIQHGRISLVLERKTRQDLSASLIDGRFASQRERLVNEYGKSRIGYIIEGSTCWEERSSGAEIALIVRDGIPVFWSQDVIDTADLIARLIKSNLIPRSDVPESNSKPSASVRMTPTQTEQASAGKRACIVMMQCVPGVSEKRAQVLANRFKSIGDLAAAIANDKEDTLNTISHLKDTASGRRFGGKVASRIVQCLSNSEEAEQSEHIEHAGPASTQSERILFTCFE